MAETLYGLPRPASPIYVPRLDAIVISPTGIPTIDTPAIQRAHDHFGSVGGKIILGPGTFAIDPNKPLFFTKRIHLQGAGILTTILGFNSLTGTAITVNATDCTFEDFWLNNTASGTASAGGGILVSSAGDRHRYRSIAVSGFYRCLDVQYGQAWVMESCYINGYVSEGVRIQNLTNGDAGDMSISGCTFSSDLHTGANAAVRWLSAGGLRFVDNKINATSKVTNSVGLLVLIADGVTTSCIIASNNSMENTDLGIKVALNGTTGILSNILLNGNEINACNDGIAVSPGTSGKISNVMIGQNTFTNCTTVALVLGNIDNVKYGPNVYAANGTNITLNAGITNSTVIGGG